MAVASRSRRLAAWSLFIGLWGWVVVTAGSWLTDLALAPPPQRLDSFYGAAKCTPMGVGLPFKDISLRTRDGVALKAWYISDGRPTSASKVCVLSHGHLGNRAQLLELLPWIRDLGFDIFMADLRHHGESGGEFFTFGYREGEDLVEISRFLASLGYERRQMVGFGLSMGATATLRAEALGNPFCALILDSCSSDIRDTIGDFGRLFFGFPSWVSRLGILAAEARAGIDLDGMVGYEDARKVAVPVLLIHGADDDRIPPMHAMRLRTALGEKARLEIVAGAGHAVAFFVKPEEYKKAVVSLLTDAGVLLHRGPATMAR